MHLFAINVGALNGTVISKHHQDEKFFKRCLRVLQAPLDKWRAPGVHYNEICLFAWLKVAELVVHGKGPGSSQGAQIKGFEGGERISLKLSHLVGIFH